MPLLCGMISWNRSATLAYTSTGNHPESTDNRLSSRTGEIGSAVAPSIFAHMPRTAV